MADASIIIDTKLENRQFVAGSKEMLQAINSFKRSTIQAGKDMRASVSGYGTAMRASIKANREARASMEELRQKARELEKAQEQLGKAKVATDKYKELLNNIKALRQEHDRLAEKRAQMESLGRDMSTPYKKLLSDIASIRAEMDKTKEAMIANKKLADELSAGNKAGKDLATGKALTRDEIRDRAEEIKLIAEEQNSLITMYKLAEEKLKDYTEQQNQMKSSGKWMSEPYKTLMYNLTQNRKNARALNVERAKMVNNGSAFMPGENSEAFKENERRLEEISDRYNEVKRLKDETFKPPYLESWQNMVRLSGMLSEGFGRIQNVAAGALHAIAHPIQALDRGLGFIIQKAGQTAVALAKMAGKAALSFLRKLADGAKNAAIQLAKLAGNAIKGGLAKLGGLAANAAKGILGLGKSAKKSNGGLGASFKTILKYAFGIRSLFFLFRRLRSAVTEGLGEIAKHNPELKSAIDSLKKSFNALKGSLATAFAPIVTAVAPAITTLINMLTNAINTIGAFIAALTGKTTYQKSIGAIGSEASSSAKGVKELNRQLASFDQLDILADNKSGSGSSGASGGGFAYETEEIDSGISDFAKQLKQMWEDADFEGIGQTIAGKINGFIDKAQKLITSKELDDKISSIVNGVTGAFNGLVSGIDWENLGKTFGEGANKLIKTINDLFEKTNFENLGKGLAEALNGLGSEVDWEELGKFFKNKIEAIIDIIKGLVNDFEWGEAGLNFATTVKGFYDKQTWDDLTDTIGTAINGVLDALSNAVKGFEWGQVGKDFAAEVNRLKNKVDWPKLGDTLAGLLGAAISAIKNFAVEIEWEDGATKITDAINEFFKNEEIWKDVGTTFNELLNGALDFSIQFLNNFDEDQFAKDVKAALGKVEWGQIASKVWELFKAALTSAGNFIDALFGNDVPQPVVKPNGKHVAEQALIDEDKAEGGIEQSLGGTLSKLAKSILAAIKSAFGAIPWNEWGTKIKDFFTKDVQWKDIWDGVYEVFKTAFNGLGEFIKGLFGIESDGTDGTALGGTVGTIGASLAGAGLIKKIFGGLFGTSGAGSGAASGALISTGHGVGNGFTIAGIAAMAKSAITNIKGLAGVFKEYENEGYGSPIQFFIDAIGSLFNGDGPKWDDWFEESANTLYSSLGLGNTGTKILETLGIKEDGTNRENKDTTQSTTLNLRDGLIEIDNANISSIDDQGYNPNTNRNQGTLPAETQQLVQLIKFGKQFMEQGKSVDEIIAGYRSQGISEKTLQSVEAALRGNSKALKETPFGKEIREALEQGEHEATLKWETSGEWNSLFEQDKPVQWEIELMPVGTTDAKYKNKGLLQYLKDIFSPGTSTEARVELLRQGWDTVSGWVSTFKGLQTIAQNVGLSKLWDTVSSWVAGLMGNTSVNQGVGLSKVWSTVSAWVSSLMGDTNVSQSVGLSKIWSTVSSWVAGLMGNTAVNQGVGLSKVWSTVSAWVAGLMGNTSVNQSVGLGKAWSTVSAWVAGYMGSTSVSQGVGLIKSGWTFVKNWVEGSQGGTAGALVGLVKSGWTWLSTWAEANRNGVADAWVGLVRSGWSDLSSWVEVFRGGNANAWVGLVQNGWTALGAWAASVSTSNYTDVWANLVQNWTGTALSYLSLDNLTTTIKASLAIDKKANKVTASFSGGGTGVGVWTLATKALGGIFQAGAWRSIPQYARGTLRAGSIFAAGEAGPELVGHVGGRTEVLNKSQLASTMYSAVTAGMVTALRGLQFRVPAMATGGVLPYEVSAQIAKSTADLQGTLNANNEDLIQTIISVAGQIVAAIQRQPSGGGSVGGPTAQQLINEINRRTQMFSASPLKGV